MIHDDMTKGEVEGGEQVAQRQSSDGVVHAARQSISKGTKKA
jgi:hypothetical protein